jgi:DNA-binding protein YbaB
MKENQKVQQQMKEAWDFEMDNMEFTDSDSDGKVEFEVEHPKEMLDKWRTASVNDTLAKKKLVRDFKKYQASIAA